MTAETPTVADTGPRAEPRSNVFLATILSSSSGSAPGRIRNISTTGALIEAPVVPREGSTVRMVRGKLSVAGAVVWADANRCGVRFSSSVVPREWMASATNSSQQRIDEIVSQVKAGAVPLPVGSERRDVTAPRRASDISFNEQVELHLDIVCRLMESLGDDLANDMEVVGRHASKLQFLDIGVQTLTALAKEFSRGNFNAPRDEARLADLLRSCEEALNGSQ